MIALLFKNFIRSKTVIVSLLLILLLGFTAIFIGRQFITKQENAIAEVSKYQQEHIARNVKFYNQDVGYLLYYLRFAFINKPEPLAALSIGQRDVNPAIQTLTIRTLEAQKYDTDFNNPANLISGNLDLGFVIIYLFPLLIIAFTFNIISEEKEGGTWRLVSIQSKSTLKYSLQKIFIRAFLLYLVLGFLFMSAIFILSLPVNEAFLAFLLLSFLYLSFWFSLCFWIISFKRSTSYNVLALLSSWVLLSILLPAGLNNIISNAYPVPESLSTIVKQRDGYHEKWDQDVESIMNKFYARFPQFKDYPMPETSFNWTWYYAMQHMGDEEAAQHSQEMKRKIYLREEVSRKFALAIPTMHTQLLFHDLAHSSLKNHMDFLESTSQFHEKNKLYFYDKIFKDAPVANEDWTAFEPEFFIKNSNINWTITILPVLLISIVLQCISIFNFKRNLN